MYLILITCNISVKTSLVFYTQHCIKIEVQNTYLKIEKNRKSAAYITAISRDTKVVPSIEKIKEVCVAVVSANKYPYI